MSHVRPPDGEILAEQLLYGSFSDRPGGYFVRFRSQGVNDAISDAVVQRCDNWGEIIYPQFHHSLMHLPIPAHQTGGAGPLTMVDLISHLGVDSSGRRGAQMHHVLILTPEEFGRFGADPFLLLEAGAFLESWPGKNPTGPVAMRVPAIADHHAALLAQATAAELRTALRAAMDIIDHAKILFWVESDPAEVITTMRLCWILLPAARRREVHLATFAFLNRNDFDLAVVYSDLAPSATRDVLHGGAGEIDLSRHSEAARSHHDRIWPELGARRFREAAAILAETEDGEPT